MDKAIRAVVVFTLCFYLGAAWIAWDWLWFNCVTESAHRAIILVIYLCVAIPLYLQN